MLRAALLGKILFIFLLLPLIYSVIFSGYNYTFDNDEISNIYKSFLISNEFKPYTQFFSHYSPVFHWVLSPLVALQSITVQTLSLGRALMIVLFLVRTISLFILTKKVFNSTVASIAVLVLLLDSVHTFTSMQIRPDNLAVTFLILGLTLFAHFYKSRLGLSLSGVLIALSAVTLVKFVPSVLIFLALLVLRNSTQGKFKQITPFMYGFLLPVLVFFLIHMVQSNLIPMLRQTTIDAARINQANPSEANISFWYSPNAFVAGQPRPTPIWIFAWFLLAVSFMGAYSSFIKSYKNLSVNHTDLLRVYLAISLVVNFSILFYVNTLYSQYFISLTYLFAIFSAVAIHEVFSLIFTNKKLAILMVLLLVLPFFKLYSYSYNINLVRGTNGKKLNDYSLYNFQYFKLPQGTYAFPYIFGYHLFRLTPEVTNQFQDAADYIQQAQPSHIFIDPIRFSQTDTNTQNLINALYDPLPNQYALWKKS